MRANKGELYYYIDIDGFVRNETKENEPHNHYRYENGNYFNKSKDAEMISEIQKLNRKLYLFSKSNNHKNIDLDDVDEIKYFININRRHKIVGISCLHSDISIFEIGFCSKEVAKKAIIENRELFEKIYKGYTFNI